MKRFWKIFGITLGSIIAVLIIAVCIVVYVVFTPSRLTPIVRNVAAQYVTTEHNIGEVELTFFSTFPEFGLQISDLYIVNPIDGAQSDTLLMASKVVAKVDLKKLLKQNSLDVRQLQLSNSFANIFIDENGNNNYSVFNLPADSVEEDTVSFSLPFDEIKVGDLELQLNNVSFVSLKDSINANLSDILISAAVNNLDDISLKLSVAAVAADIAGEQYADNLALTINAPHTALQLSPLALQLNNAALTVADFVLQLQGDVSIEEDIKLDVHAEAQEWNIPQLLALLPQSIVSLLDGIDIDAATLSLKADVAGVYNDSTMPIINADLLLADAQAAYMEMFPYKISDIQLAANAHIDLNQKKNCSATIGKLHARTGKTVIDATGKIYELLDDMLADVRLQLNVNLPQFDRYISGIEGVANGTVNAKYRLSALKKMQLKKGSLNGDIRLRDFAFLTDSMSVKSPDMRISLQVPNNNPTKSKVDFANVNVALSGLDFEMTNKINAKLGDGKLHAQVSDVLSDNPVIYADIKLEDKTIVAQIDSVATDGQVNTYITADLLNPSLSAYAEYNTKDSSVIPVVDANLAFEGLQAVYTDIKANLKKSALTASLAGRSEEQPQVNATITTDALAATIGSDMSAQTAQLSLAVAAHRNPEKDNILLQWNPKLDVKLADGIVSMKSIKENIEIPHIDFNYSNKHFNINDSRILLGNSDFSLKGDIHNIGPWLDKKDKLKGELMFTSQHTDANELMALFSADKGSEEETVADNTTTEETKQEADNTQSEPFLVPTDVDFSFVTDIREAVVFDQLARELGGHLYVKDGILILEEMGFICNAAKLQLTAMYKTPRRNHLFLGLDYHMIDINIQELVNMIPQIDTMMPMLRSFRGGAELHLAAETYLNANYDIKPSTTRGAVSITGKDLVLLDSETFGKIAKLLMFNKKTENKVDSISVQATLFKKEIDIYPFCMSIDNYMAAVGGRHNLDMTFDYHISLLKPLYLGVDVGGNFDDLKIKLAKCRYAQDFRPIFRKDVETQNASLKKMINEALKRTVRIE